MDSNFMIGFACAILASFCGSILATQYKALRMHDVSSSVTMAVRGLTTPFWLVGFLIFIFYVGKQPETNAVYWIVAWAVFGISSAWLRTFLMKYQNLSELNALLRGTSFIVLLASDILFFNQEFKFVTVIAAAVLILCGLIFSAERTVTKKKYELKGSYLKVIGIIVFISCLVAVQLVFYKKAAIAQNDPLFFAFMASLIINPMNFMLAPKGVVKLIHKDIGEKHKMGILRAVLLIIFMLIIVEITQAKAYLELPLIIVNVAAVIPVIVYFIADRVNGEVAWSWKSGIAFVCAIGSLVAIMTS